MKKNLRFTILIFAGILLILFSYIWRWRESELYQSLKKLPDHIQVAAILANRPYTFEVVNTSASTAQGLSDRAQIGSDGMLFVMPTKSFYSFWMPRMHFDLDILWFADDTLVQIMPNVPAAPSGTLDIKLPLYTNEKKANLVLELPAGQAQKDGLQVGDKLHLKN